MRIHHYGFAARDLECSMNLFKKLGYRVSKPVLDSVQKVRISFVEKQGEPPIELICDICKTGPTAGFISKVGSGLYHICYETENISQAIAELREQGFMVRQRPLVAEAFEGRRIAWLYSRDAGLVELVEKTKDGE